MKTLDIEIGGRVVRIEPLPSVRLIAEFWQACSLEIADEDERVNTLRIARRPTELAASADIEGLLKLGAPHIFTDELLDRSTAPERTRALAALVEVNSAAAGARWAAQGWPR